jgi:hypothetical protein
MLIKKVIGPLRKEEGGGKSVTLNRSLMLSIAAGGVAPAFRPGSPPAYPLESGRQFMLSLASHMPTPNRECDIH